MKSSISFPITEVCSLLYATKFAFKDSSLPSEYRTVWWFDTNGKTRGNEQRRVARSSRYADEVEEVYLVGEDILQTLDKLNVATPMFSDRQIYKVSESPVLFSSNYSRKPQSKSLQFYAIPDHVGNKRFTEFARLATQSAYDWFDEILREDPQLLQEKPYRSIGQSLFWWTLTSVDGRSARPIGVPKSVSEDLMEAHYHALIGGEWNTAGLYNSVALDRGWKRPKQLI
jgi:hypothetical protein